MRDFLKEILKYKKFQVEALKLEKEFYLSEVKEKHSLIERLKESSCIEVISEIKRASPSKGPLNMKIEPCERARRYKAGGACAISVLTEDKYFKGSIEDLIAVRNAVDIPVLRKDFIIDKIQLEEAAFYGADVILLIVAALEQKKLEELYIYSQELGLEALIEVHDERELQRALELKPELIGINNRNLKTFQIDLVNSVNLAPIAKREGALVIAESGISKLEQVEVLSEFGINGILVGESLVTNDDYESIIQNFRIPSR